MTLIARTKEILLHPKAEWQVIAGEPASPAELYTKVVLPLAAIGPVATLIGWSVFGIPIPFVGTYRVPLGPSVTSAVVRYMLGLVGVFVLALIIDLLAPRFGGQKSQVQALKVAAFSSTAAWLAGIFALIPALSVLGLVGLYSLYLLYAGLPIVMKAPPERALGYTVVVMVAAVVLFLVIGAIAARFAVLPGLGALGVPGT
jgi:Yip1 domain